VCAGETRLRFAVVFGARTVFVRMDAESRHSFLCGLQRRFELQRIQPVHKPRRARVSPEWQDVLYQDFLSVPAKHLINLCTYLRRERVMKIKRSLVLCISSLLAFSSAAMSSASFDQETPVARIARGPQRSFLGVELGEITRDTVQRLKLREERGALIEEVTAGSSAAEAGLLSNDVIVKWDGESIESAREVSRHIRETPPGRSVRLGVIREGREIEINLKMGERQAIITRPRIVSTTPIARAELRAEAMRAREEARAATTRAREETRAAVAQAREEARAAVRVREQVHVTGRLGVQLQSMTPQLAEYFGLSKRSGALVVFVYADSAAAKAGLKAGDVILSAGGQTVETPMELRHALADKQ